MSAWWAFGLVYLLFAVGCGGALWERERLLNAGGERGVKWWGALVLSSALWPVVGLLWGPSRPVPAQPPQAREEPWKRGPGVIAVDLMYRGSITTPGTRMVLDYETLRTQGAPEGSVAMVTSENRLYTRYDGEWVVYRDPDCPRCDHDDHRCHGCGEPLPHALVVCRNCMKENL